MRASLLGLLVSCVLFACSGTKRDFRPHAGDGGVGGLSGGNGLGGGGGVMTGGASGRSGTSTAGAATEAGAAGMAGSDSCSDDEYDDGTSCHKLTACTDAEYEKAPPSAAADRVCAPLTVCGAGAFVSTQPGAQIDRACSPCPASTFSSVLNAVACAPWAQCKSGETESVPPSATSDRVCSTCGAGKYQVDNQCQPLTVCSASEYESVAATAVSNRKCSAITTCQPGSKQTAAATSTTDRQCAACSAGSFSTQANATTCKAWTACTSTQTQSVAGTATTDAVCVDKPVCSTAKDRTCTTQCPCASAEGVCTASNQCASGATCVAGSGKKVGRSGDTCLATHCNNDQLDSGETSVDCGGECGCRATFDIVGFKGLSSGSTFSEFRGMSRDGKRLVGSIGRGQNSFPAVIATDGTVTELETYGKGGALSVANSDGSVVIGQMLCANPPSCSQGSTTLTQWTGSTAPKVLITAGSPRGVSSSGTIVAGDLYDSSTSSQIGFILNNNQSQVFIPEFSSVGGITPDGKYVAGVLKSGIQGGVWLAQTQVMTKFGATDWNSVQVNGVNGTDPAVIGYGYITAGDKYVGYRWKGGVLTNLDVLAGGVYSTPNGISSDGSTVVGTTGSNAFQQAFIWTDKDKLRTIVDELKARGLEPAVDLLLTNANYISDDGKTIVGVQYTQPPTFWRVVLE